jgi:hypothetical protein
MSKNIQIKPSRNAGVGQMIGGFVTMIISLVFVIPMISKTNGPVWFGGLMVVVALVNMITGAINVFSRSGIPTEELVMPNEPVAPSNTEGRLRELDGLRDKRLISNEEYKEKRRQILEKL